MIDTTARDDARIARARERARAMHNHLISTITDEVYDLLARSPLTRAEIITLLGDVKDRIADLPLLNADPV